MSARQFGDALGALFKILVLRRRVPLFAEWNVTFRCNLRCKYCGACDVDKPELDTAAITSGLEELWTLGCRWITFGGGEPLLRRDIEPLAKHAKSLGFQVFMSTNGSLLPGKESVLAYVDHVNLSLDGGREAHDAVRGEGTFDKTLAAARICKEAGVDVSFQNVLSSLNLDQMDATLEVARDLGMNVMFQPATKWLDSSTEPNPIAPPVEEYRAAMGRLMALKKQGAPVRNSMAGLRHLAKWPEPTRIWCSAGIVTCSVEPDGAMIACHQCQVGRFLKDETEPGPLRQQFEELALPRNCVQCWCAPLVELALLFSFNPGAILNAFRSFL